MALSDLTFKLYQDANLTIPFGGILSLLHNTDLSDNPQDFQLWFGSLGSAGTNTTDRKLRAVSDPGVDNIVLTPTDTLPAFTPSIAYTLGQSVKPTVDNGLRYEVTTAGTASTEPTWPTSGVGSTVASGSVVFTLRGPQHEITEVKLASSQAGLDSATGGAAYSGFGTQVTSGTANAETFWIRITNAVTVVSNNTGTPEIGIYINGVQEEAN